MKTRQVGYISNVSIGNRASVHPNFGELICSGTMAMVFPRIPEFGDPARVHYADFTIVVHNTPENRATFHAGRRIAISIDTDETVVAEYGAEVQAMQDAQRVGS